MLNRLVWWGLFTVVVFAAGGAMAVVTIFTYPSLGVPVTVIVTAVAVTAVALLLVLAIPAVRAAHERAEAAVWARYADETELHAAVDAAFGGTEAHVSAPWHDFAQSSGSRATGPARDPAGDAAGGVPDWFSQDTANPAGPLSADQQFVRLVFVTLARRLQSFIGRSLNEIDDLQAEYEDPKLLAGLWRLDHLFTLARRQAENLAVLGGQSPNRRSTEPVEIHQLLLAANSEIERFKQVAIIPVNMPGAPGPTVPDVHGEVAAEIIHLLAELLENATQLSPPGGSKVEVRAHRVAAGLAIEVSDHGLGMSFEEQQRVNRILDGTDQIDVGQQVRDGRIGLAVVRELAARHSINVELKRNIYGGVVAAVVIPPQLLVDPANPPAPTPRRRRLDAAAEQDRTSQRALLVSAPADTAEYRGRLIAPPAPVAPTLTTPHRMSLDADTDATATHATRAATGAVSPIERPQVSPPHVSPSRESPPRERPVSEERPVALSRGDITADQVAPPGHLPPPLPVRQRGLNYAALATSAPTSPAPPTTETFEPVPNPGRDTTSSPPPLPVRGTHSHMPSQLLEPPVGTSVSPGHNVDLYAQVRAGQAAWPSDTHPDSNHPDSTHASDGSVAGGAAGDGAAGDGFNGDGFEDGRPTARPHDHTTRGDHT